MDMSLKYYNKYGNEYQRVMFDLVSADYSDWTPEEKEGYFSFLSVNGVDIVASDNNITLLDVFERVVYLKDALEAFYFINDGVDRSELLDYVLNYQLAGVAEVNLLKHFTENHEHIYPVSNGYVFYIE